MLLALLTEHSGNVSHHATPTSNAKSSTGACTLPILLGSDDCCKQQTGSRECNTRPIRGALSIHRGHLTSGVCNALRMGSKQRIAPQTRAPIRVYNGSLAARVSPAIWLIVRRRSALCVALLLCFSCWRLGIRPHTTSSFVFCGIAFCCGANRPYTTFASPTRCGFLLSTIKGLSSCLLSQMASRNRLFWFEALRNSARETAETIFVFSRFYLFMWLLKISSSFVVAEFS